MDFLYGLLSRALGNQPEWLLIGLAGLIMALILVHFMALGPLLYVYAETKIAGFMQDRIGPKRVGPHGMLQTVADAVKLLFKEAIFPQKADKLLFVLAPCLVVIGAFLSFVVIPFGGRSQTADLNIGVFYVVAVSSLSTVGIIMAGWASNNKYALFGAMRSAAQIVSYEIPAVMSLLVVVIMVGSLSLQEIVGFQKGGLQNWLLFRYFPLNLVAFLVFFTASLAECNRAPFDIPEAESELVAGFHTEYSSMRFALLQMAEYVNMITVAAVGASLFFGGWLAPVPALQRVLGYDIGILWFFLKMGAGLFFFIWLRGTLPRFRYDQLMHFGWKVLVPLAALNILATAGWIAFR